MSRKTDASSAGGGGAAFAVGTYVGNGVATQAVVGVGFQPKVVMIYSLTAFPTVNMHGVKADADGVNAWFINFAAGQWAWGADQIVSLDVNGFTVGDGTPIVTNIFNVVGTDYMYVCWG